MPTASLPLIALLLFYIDLALLDGIVVAHVRNSLAKAHALTLAWREHDEKETKIRIMDGWNKSVNKINSTDLSRPFLSRYVQLR